MIMVADNLSASRPSLAKAVKNRDAEAITSLCRRAEQAGAAWLDINPGFLSPALRRDTWEFLVTRAERACSLTLVLDSPDPEQLALGLKFCTRPPVLNMATAQESRLDPMLELARKHGVQFIAATMTNTVPETAEERLALAAQILKSAAEAGLAPGQVILDPMVMPLGLPGGERHATGVLGMIRALPQFFDPVPPTLIGLSNLATHTAGQRAGFASAPFLAAACGAGLSHVLMDAFNPELVRMVKLCKVFSGRAVFAPAEFSS